METPAVPTFAAAAARSRSLRAGLVALLGPATVAAGAVWGILQPDRLTFLHPRGQGFWWLAAEPPVLVAAVGVLFTVFVARPVLADLENASAASG